MNILYGLYRPTSGHILLKGQEVEISSALKAIELGIGMVHQHFMLIPAFTVLENIILGLPSQRKPLLDVKNARERITKLISDYGLSSALSPDAKIESLSTGLRQQVEILKTLYRGADLLVMDEPTGVLTPQETVEFFHTLKNLASQGHSVIFISHKLDEVMQISDRVSVLHKGKLVTTVETAQTNKEELARLMVGREVTFHVKREATIQGKAVLEVDHLSVPFQVRRGEILGIAGVDGNGQSELMEALSGLRRPTSGRICLDGEDISALSCRQLIDRGIAFVPEERKGVGAVPGLNINENLMLRRVGHPPFSCHHILNRAYTRKLGDQIIEQYDVRLGNREIDADLLSGGNLQKIVLARELNANPKVLLAMHPTRGLDVGAIQFIHSKFLECTARGVAIVLVSTELDEIMTLSDRILVLCDGVMTGELSRAEATVERIGAYMAGVSKA